MFIIILRFYLDPNEKTTAPNKQYAERTTILMASEPPMSLRLKTNSFRKFLEKCI